MPDRLVDRADRLRQLGVSRLLDRAGRLGLRRLPRTARARRHRGREPDPVRGPERRGVFGHARADVRRDVAGLQRVWRQQPLHVHGGVPAGEPGRLQGRVLGLLQPAVRRHGAGQRALVSLLRRVPDDPVHRAQRLRRELHEPGRRRRQRGAAPQPQDDRLQRARRVLVRRRERRTSRPRATPA